jgi:hypothetical protein
MYKYISFIEQEPKAKTKVFAVMSKQSNVLLGSVKWYGPWRRYCLFIDKPGFVFDAGCLADIQDFMNRLMAERRKSESNI